MSGSSRETLPAVRGWWEAFPDVRERSGGPPECTGEVRKPSRMSKMPSRISGGGEEVLSNV